MQFLLFLSNDTLLYYQNSTKMWGYHNHSQFSFPVEGVLPYKRLMGMCRWMGSHFHDWVDYNEVAFLTKLLPCEQTLCLGKK